MTKAALAVATAALAPLLFGAAGCEPRKAEARRALPPGAPFIALERDFQGFRRWEELSYPERSAQSLTHVAGKRRGFVSERPPGDAVSFPVGTIVVKEILGGAAEGHQLFAMVKRGGGFNGQGAPGWEWFELRERGDGSVGIVWRGINAPDGESYGGDPMGGCNGCHEMAAKNDFVKGRALRLSRSDP